jgi:hypothetical protein
MNKTGRVGDGDLCIFHRSLAEHHQFFLLRKLWLDFSSLSKNNLFLSCFLLFIFTRGNCLKEITLTAAPVAGPNGKKTDDASFLALIWFNINRVKS